MYNNCCTNKVINKKEKRLLKGVFYGLLPHSFCIGFILFSVIGSLSAVAFFKKALMIPYFFQTLIVMSFAMATLSAFLYLKKNKCLCKKGIKNKWKYLTILYGVTIFTNLFVFFYVFPMLANINYKQTDINNQQLTKLSVSVEIPCSGHAPLIIDEFKKDNGIKNVKFNMPNIFNIEYDSSQTSPEKIMTMEIFKNFKVENIKIN